MRRAGVALAAVVAAFGVAAPAATQEEEIVVTLDSRSLPSGCTPREAAQLLVRLANAVNAGDTTGLDRLLAIEDPPGRAVEEPRPYFRWYSVTEGRIGTRPWRHTVFYDRADALPYFAQRHRLNERWQLISVDVGPGGWIPGSAGIGYVIRRTADDLHPSTGSFAHGKGMIDCVAQRIFVWSMGQVDDGSVAPVSCPRPLGWTHGSSILACARSAAGIPAAGANARAVTSDFRVTGAAGLPARRCAPRAVSTRLRSALTAFNAGRGGAFARHFGARGELAFAGQATAAGHAAITHAVADAYARGDGWTATSARAVRAPSRSDARYRVALLLSSPGRPLARGNATVSFDCRSGLIERWSGPS